MTKQTSHMKHRRTDNDELQQRNGFGTVSRKTTGRAGGGGGAETSFIRANP